MVGRLRRVPEARRPPVRVVPCHRLPILETPPVKLHPARTDLPIDLGDVTAGTNRLYIATQKGWSCWMGAFIEPNFLLGYPVEHWPLIAQLKLPEGSVNTIHARHLLPKTGMGTSLALLLARLN